MREVDIPLGAIEELGEWLTRRPNYQGEDEPVFVSDPPNMTPRTRQTCRNVEQRIKDAIKRANIRLDKLGIEPISERVTPHSLRRTYASLRAACGDDPVYIAEQLGHTDMNLTFNIYQKAVKRRAKLSGAHLRELDRALEWASLAGSRLSFASQPAEKAPVPE